MYIKFKHFYISFLSLTLTGTEFQRLLRPYWDFWAIYLKFHPALIRESATYLTKRKSLSLYVCPFSSKPHTHIHTHTHITFSFSPTTAISRLSLSTKVTKEKSLKEDNFKIFCLLLIQKKVSEINWTSFFFTFYFFYFYFFIF